MPSNLDPGDRKILLIAGAILLLLVVATLALAPPGRDAEGQGVPSTYSTANNGAQAAYLMLRELGYRSERWEKSPAELPLDPDGSVLILAAPSNFPDKNEREALLKFVRSGGWIIYAGNYPFLFLEYGAVTPASIRKSNLIAESYPALAPSPFTRGVPEITIFANNRWVTTGGFKVPPGFPNEKTGEMYYFRAPAEVPLYGEPDAPVVVTWRLEKGRILWWAAPTPLTNAGISRPGNLAFFLNCVQAARPGAGPEQKTILWDEYFHGYRGSLWDYFQETPVPWAIFQLAVIAVLVFLTFGRRSGPLYTPVTTSRLSPLEFVDTLGDLYHRGNAGPAAVRVAYTRFRIYLTRRLALASSISNMQLDAAVRERLGWKQPGLFDTLQRAEKSSHASDLAGADALKIIQALEHYEHLFGLKTRNIEEKR